MTAPAPDPQAHLALPLSRALDPKDGMEWGNPAYRTLGCPKCGFHNTSAVATSTKPAKDMYEAVGGGWSGRGDLLVIHMDCEEGHNWDICIGFHKGSSAIFVRVGEDDPSPETAG